MNKKILAVILLIIAVPARAPAQTLSEYEATPSVITENGAKLLITEVNMKNTSADWVELYYESPASKPLNLKDLSFGDDAIFKKISTDFTVPSGAFVLLTFKSAQSDSPPYMYSSRSGLTGTTEQLIVYDRNNRIIDAVCWSSATPTSGEIEDMSKLFADAGWNSANAGSCIESEQVKTGESISRRSLTDTGGKTDWVITDAISPAAPFITPVVTQEAAENPAEAVPADEDEAATEPYAEIFQSENEPVGSEENPEIEESATTEIIRTKPETEKKKTATDSVKKKTATAKKSKKSSQTYRNGDHGNDIVISELLPNPEGSDGSNEWIELFNAGEEDINLGNWTLDDGDGGSRPFLFSDSTVIKGGDTLLISIKESKISLGNKEDQVQLINFKGETMAEVSYEEAPEEQSYARINIVREDGEEESTWLWTAELTPGKPNPVYEEISGEIIGEPSFEENYFFKVKQKDRQEIIVYFDEGVVAGPLAKATFTRTSRIRLLVEKNEKGQFQLKSYEIIEPAGPDNADDFMLPSILGSLLTAGGSAFYFIRKKMKAP